MTLERGWNEATKTVVRDDGSKIVQEYVKSSFLKSHLERLEENVQRIGKTGEEWDNR